MALLKPIRQSLQIDGECGEAPDRLWIAIRGHGHEDFRRPHIDSCGVRFDNGQADSLVALLGHDISLSAPLRRPEPCEKGSISNEIVSLSTSEKRWRHHCTEHGAQNHTAGRA